MIMPVQINGETYLTTSEAMGKLGVSRPTFDALVKSGRLTRYKQGIRQTHYYKLSDLDRLLEVTEDTSDEE